MRSSRRNFLVAGIGLPALASASRSADPEPQTRARRSSDVQFEYRTLGKTGLKVTAVGFGCMITSDGSVIERAADMGITYFDTARGYSERQQRAHGRRGAQGQTQQHHALEQDRTPQPRKRRWQTSIPACKELGTDHLDIWYLHAKTKPEDVTDDLIDAQQTAKKAGKIRFAGVSTHSGQPQLIPLLAEESQYRCDPDRLQLHPGARRRPRPSKQAATGGQGRSGHEGDGGRIPHHQAGRSRLRQAETGWRLAGGAQVGHAQSRDRSTPPSPA